MVVLDEKTMLQMPPPPPYAAPPAPPPFPQHLPAAPEGFGDLPPNVLLHVVYSTFPQHPGLNEGRIERQRKTLYWLSTGLRLVNRAFYVACMHVLRSTYLPAYNALIRPPCTSDPFPYTSPSGASPLRTLQRETQVLDLFIALKVREDVWADDTEFHLERDESFRDLFDLNQPRARLEDLLRFYGVKAGVISLPNNSSTSTLVPLTPSGAGPSGSASGSGSGGVNAPPSYATPPLTPLVTAARKEGLPFSALSIAFSPRNVGLVLNSGGRKRTIVQVSRVKGEKLEASAKKLVGQLELWLQST